MDLFCAFDYTYEQIGKKLLIAQSRILGCLVACYGNGYVRTEITQLVNERYCAQRQRVFFEAGIRGEMADVSSGMLKTERLAF